MKKLEAMLALTAGGVLLQACSTVLTGPPRQPGTDFTVEDPALAEALRDAAEDWARHGLEVASYVTINQNERGVPVYYGDQKEIHAACPNSTLEYIGACTSWRNAQFRKLVIDRGTSPERLATVLRHELIHFLVPNAPHLDEGPDALPGAVGVTTLPGNSPTITRADMGHLAKYTLVLPSDAPFEV